MLWIEADLIDVGLSRRVLNFENEIRAFVRAYGFEKLLGDSLGFWRQEEKKIVLPFRQSFSRIDLSFLIGVANIGTARIACSAKACSVQKDGYMVFGFDYINDKLALIENVSFSGFRSGNWSVLYLRDGYSVFVHVQGAVSIWRLLVEMEDEKVFLVKDLVFSSSDKRLFQARDEKKLIKALQNRPGLYEDSVAILADAIYNVYKDLQRFKITPFLAAKESRVSSLRKEKQGAI